MPISKPNHRGALPCAIILTIFASALAGCGSDSDATIGQCEPVESCSCTDGVERDTSCSCAGGSDCAIDGDNIEFSCDGNAACGLSCGTDCLITCPGTTSCTVETGDRGEITCPGTAECDITCVGDCSVDFAGTATGVVRCLEATASCQVNGCAVTDCGGGVSACRTSCPTPNDAGP